MAVRSYGENVMILQHESANNFTVVDLASQADDRAIFCITQEVVGSEFTMHFSEPEGNRMGSLLFGVDGTVHTELSDAAGTAASAAPDISYWQYACFFLCLGENVTNDCATYCFHCAANPALSVQCIYCTVCSGANGVKCAKKCRK